MLSAAILGDLPHGFSTRQDPDFEGIFDGAPLILAKQVHSAKVATVTAPWEGAPPEVDALVTATRGILIGVVTADCCPVLLADRSAGIVGAAHAGWRGALDGVIGNTVDAMEMIGAERTRIAAAIGPTIAQESYEVDTAMRERFPAESHRFFHPGAQSHWQFDLPGFVRWRLEEAGVAAIEGLAEDTYAQPDLFFSYRRATHRGEPTGGRQTSVIGIG